MAPEDSDGNQRIMGPAVTMGGYEKGSCPVIYPKVPEVHRAIGYIRAIACRSIANGHPDGTFRPELKVNRAQMAVFASRTFPGLDEQGKLHTIVAVKALFRDYVKDERNRSLNEI